MVALTPTSQRTFIRGINASVSRMAQPKGTVPRATNLIFTRRGSLSTIDGSAFVFVPVSFSNNPNAWHAMGEFVDTHNQQLAAPALVGMTSIPGRSISQPTGLALVGTSTVNALTIETTANEGLIEVANSQIVTVHTTTAHNLAIGQLISITGAGLYNVWAAPVLSIIDASRFTYFCPYANLIPSGGGNVAAGACTPGLDYYYQVVAVDTSGNILQTLTGQLNSGHSLPSAEFHAVTLGVGKNAITISWTAAQNAAGFLVYGTRLGFAGQEVLISGYIPNTLPGGTLTFTDLGQVVSTSSGGPQFSPPVTDTSTTTSFISITDPAHLYEYTPLNIIGDLPAMSQRAAKAGYGAFDGSIGGYTDAWSPYGGIQGTTSAVPSFVPVDDKMVLCLGNSFPPFVFDGDDIAQVTSTFVTALPNWIAATYYAVGNYTIPTTGNVNGHYFKCIQAGTTSATEPAWTSVGNYTGVSGQQWNDGNVIWQEVGATQANGLASAPPSGAAVGINYAGFLWLANTAPTDVTTGANAGLDGPSALRMSDLNNPNSWNPVNAAFLGKDDGTQITGMAQFTIAEAGIIPTGSLVVFKEYSTYQITGVFGATDFSIQQAQTDLGCIAPLSVQFIPGFGITRLTHLGWAVFDGVRDRLLSEEMRPYVFSDTSLPDISAMNWGFAYNSRGTQTSVPPMYVGIYQQLNATYAASCFDLVLRAWTHIEWPGMAASAYQARTPDQLPVTYIAEGNGAIMRWQAGDEQWYTEAFIYFSGYNATPVGWSVRTPEVLGPSVTDRFYPRRLLVRGTLKATSTYWTAPTTTMQFNRANETAFPSLMRTFPAGAGGTEFELDVGITPHISTSVNCLIAGSGRYELDAFEWFTHAKSAGVPITIT